MPSRQPDPRVLRSIARVTLASASYPAACRHRIASTLREAGEIVSWRSPRRAASPATWPSSARPMPSPRRASVTTTGSTSPPRPCRISPTRPTTPTPASSATHMPDRSSLVRYSSKAAPGSPSGTGSSSYSAWCSPASSAHSWRQSRWSVGRYERIVTVAARGVSSTVSAIRSSLLRLEQIRQPHPSIATEPHRGQPVTEPSRTGYDEYGSQYRAKGRSVGTAPSSNASSGPLREPELAIQGHRVGERRPRGAREANGAGIRAVGVADLDDILDY